MAKTVDNDSDVDMEVAPAAVVSRAKKIEKKDKREIRSIIEGARSIPSKSGTPRPSVTAARGPAGPKRKSMDPGCDIPGEELSDSQRYVSSSSFCYHLCIY